MEGARIEPITDAEPHQGDVVYIEARFWKKFGEEGAEDYYELLLPEALEYRFPQASIPMVVIHRSEVKIVK